MGIFSKIMRSKRSLSSRKIYMSAFRNHPDIVYVMDLNGYFQDCNDAACARLGYSREEWLKKRVGDFSVGESRQTLLQVFEYALTGKTQQLEMLVQRRDGTEFEIDLTLVPVLLQGKVVGVYGFGKDISGRVQMERTLRESQERLARAQEMTKVGDWESDLTTMVFHCSDVTQQIFEFDQCVVSLKEVTERVHPDDRDRFQTMMENVMTESEGRVHDVEYRTVCKDGTVKHIHARGTVKVTKLGYQCVGTVQDVTERKKTEELLRQSDKLAVVGQLAAGVAHEIRNPLTTLKGFLQLLVSTEFDRPKRLEYYQIMNEALNHINFIAGEMLVLSKPQVTTVSEHDVVLILHQVVSLLNAEALLKSVEMEIHAPNQQVVSPCDVSQIKQVFVNVIKNGIEAMSPGGRLQITVFPVSDNVYLRFQDNGCGIDRDRISKLFEPFYTTKEKGTGLGLMISRKIVSEHGGAIDIISEPGNGTTVTVTLPVV